MGKLKFFFLAALIIIIFSQSSFSHENEKMDSRQNHHRRHDSLTFHEFGHFFSLLDQAKISNSQLIQLRIVFDRYKPEFNKQDPEASMRKSLDEATSIEEATEIVDRIGKMHRLRMLAMFQLQQELKKILTEDQLKKICEKGKRPGRGPQHFRRPPPIPEGEEDCSEFEKN